MEIQMKEQICLNNFKFDEAFISLFLFEIKESCKGEDTLCSCLHRLVEDFFEQESASFDSARKDFKSFINTCLLFLVEKEKYTSMCLKKFLNWFFFKIVHTSKEVKEEWKTWETEMMGKPTEGNVEVNMNMALIQACKLKKTSMYF